MIRRPVQRRYVEMLCEALFRRSLQQGHFETLPEASLPEDVLCSKAMLRCCVKQGYVKARCAARLCVFYVEMLCLARLC